MIDMFDYKKFSVLEYNQILSDWYLGKEPKDINIFKYEVQHVLHQNQNLIIKFTNNHWLRVDNKGWWCEAYSDDTMDVISNRHFYTKSRTSESLGLGNIAYTSRPSKGITYKNIMINGTDISRNGNSVRVNMNKHYHFNVEKFKKYKEYQLNTHCGLSYYERVNNKNEVLKTAIRVTDKENKDTYSISLEWGSGRKFVTMDVHKNYSRETRFNMSFKDCGIDNIFNKYLMFEFDLTSEPKDFTIVEKVRTLLALHIQNTYNKAKEEGLDVSVLGQILRRIEVIESDEYQVQKRS